MSIWTNLHDTEVETISNNWMLEVTWFNDGIIDALASLTVWRMHRNSKGLSVGLGVLPTEKIENPKFFWV